VVAGAERWWWELNSGGGRGWREKNLERVKRENENENTVGSFVSFFFVFFFFLNKMYLKKFGLTTENADTMPT
jgi:hypothetical protein